MHGGADGSGAPKGARNGNYKHGRYTKEVAAARRWLREATQMLRELKKPTDDNRNYRELSRRKGAIIWHEKTHQRIRPKYSPQSRKRSRNSSRGAW